MISSCTGTPVKIVIMRASGNQTLKNAIEGKGASASIRGGFEVEIIDGVPISGESTKHMIDFGKLNSKALKNAPKVDINDL